MVFPPPVSTFAATATDTSPRERRRYYLLFRSCYSPMKSAADDNDGTLLLYETETATHTLHPTSSHSVIYPRQHLS